MSIPIQPPQRFLVTVLVIALAGSVVSSQQPQTQDVPAPPPVKVISTLDREQLNAAKDPKARVKISISLAEAHLAKAEALTAERSFDSALGEAARYWAIMENAFAYLRALKTGNSKNRDLYKRLELALRSHGPRLTGLRRTAPSEFAIWLKEIEENARNGRTEALNSFYGDNVVRDIHRTPELQPVEKPVQQNLAAPTPTPK
ncbi:MAG TPA: hypothetical protein VNO50_04660 [Pyrinomonadaceae bacterium]|nr:hypothetical protein [Pyrinomonadaceae bacterium]